MAGLLNTLPEGDAAVLPHERDALATQGTISLQMVEALTAAGADQAVTIALTAVGARLTR